VSSSNPKQDVFVGSLPPDTTKDDLRSVFSKLGQVGEITLKSNERYAFISFNNCQGDMVAKLKKKTISIKGKQIMINYPVKNRNNQDQNEASGSDDEEERREKSRTVKSTEKYFLLGYLSDYETFNVVDKSSSENIGSISIKHTYRALTICLNTNSHSYSIEILLKDIYRINLTKREFAIQWRSAPKIFYEDGKVRRSLMDILVKNSKCNAMVLFIDPKDSNILHNIIKYKNNVEQKLKIRDNISEIVEYPSDMPIQIVLLIEALVSRNMNRYLVTKEFFYEISETPENVKLRALMMMQEEEEILNPLQTFKEKVEVVKAINPKQLTKVPSTFYPSNPDLVPTFHLIITPSKYYIEGVFYEVSNRVQRKYPQNIFNFLRVVFLDENFGPMNNMGKDIKAQFRKAIEQGICIGQWKFLFLAYSNSQLRQRSCFFMTEFTYQGQRITREYIFNDLGRFSNEKIPAKVGARIAQCFTTTYSVGHLGPDDYKEISDVEVKATNMHGKPVTYNFTDGIGKISVEYATYCKNKLGLKVLPSAFQIRFKGYKGMVVVDPTFTERKILLRKSMKKFDSDHTEFEIVGYSSYHPAYLNRQIITLLVSLGVKYTQGFERLEREMIEEASAILKDERSVEECINFVKNTNPNDYTTSLLSKYLPTFGLKEPYLRTVIRLYCQKLMNDMISRTRIHVPSGALLYGVIDEYGCLGPNEVFVKVNDEVITKKAFVTRNPCLDPGDIRVVQCVDKQRLSHLTNVVVFPRVGNRPLMDMMAGGDLDGDFYTVIWDEELIPPSTCEPAEYPKPYVKQKTVKYPKDVANFFLEYIDRDVIGLIDTSWQAYAEERGLDASTDTCRDMAEKHAIAIDFAKTGVPAEYTDNDWAKKYPEYMEKKPQISFKGTSFIAESFRRLVKHRKNTAPNIKNIQADNSLLCEGFDEYVEEATQIYLEYVEDNMRILRQYGIQSEAEILTGNILKCNKRFAKKKDYATRENLGTRLSQIREYYIHKFNEGLDEAKKKAKAAAWYFVAYQSCSKDGAELGAEVPMLGFAWLNVEHLAAVKCNK
jgi:RNA-dependent RNA polymerase